MDAPGAERPTGVQAATGVAPVKTAEQPTGRDRATAAPRDRFVEVAVDAAGGAGARTWTYRVPEAVADVAAGEAVLVDWGRRRAVGIVLGEAPAPDGIAAKPLADRIRADGPLLPPLALAVARHVAAHYLAPPAMAIRAMLPPGMLERVDLVATLLDGSAGADDTGARAIVDALATGPRPVRDLPEPDGRPALLRRLRALEAAAALHLEWTLGAAGAGPRFLRMVAASEAGRSVAGGAPAPDGRAVGPRQRALLAELAAAAGEIEATALEGRHGAGTVRALARRRLVDVEAREVVRDPLEARAQSSRGSRPVGSDLTPAQVAAVAAIDAARIAGDPTPLLLDGPTGSGKTAVYVEVLAASLAAGRPGLVLVPEVALALPLVDRLRADLRAEVVVLHSAMGEGERADGWRRIRAGLAEVVVGTRLAVLAPFADLGVVIVDEEHDQAFKSDRTPRFQARDLAVVLGRLAGAAVVLGSATPSVETFGRAAPGGPGGWRRATLPDRASGDLPSVELVDLRAELQAGNRDLCSTVLAQRLAALDAGAGERAILVINRRGAASAVICRDCGHVQGCPECTRPLVYHQAGMTLRCHHCGAAAPMPSRCPACRSPRIKFIGGGTERLESEVRARYPHLRVGRLDRDVVERRGAAERVVDDFVAGRLDVLVGTSLVTKGFDIPEVTLVGVVSADIALTLPDERAAERTWQLIVQAIGRAGRGERRGHAIVQTYEPSHPVMQAIATGRAEAFYAEELALRRRFGAPPFGRLVKLTVGLEDEAAARAAGRSMVESLRARATDAPGRYEIAGPSAAYIPRRAGRWRFNVVVRGPDPVGLLGGDPGVPWSVDVDPESTL